MSYKGLKITHNLAWKFYQKVHWHLNAFLRNITLDRQQCTVQHVRKYLFELFMSEGLEKQLITSMSYNDQK